MPGSAINVGICLDERMLNAACVMLASVVAHAQPERPVRVYALTSFAAPILHDLAATMASDRFSLVPIAVENIHAAFPIRDHITHGTYLRFLLPKLLPDVAKLVYIDVDTVVHHDLAPLFDIDLQGRPLAAMPDYPMLVGSRTWPTFFIPYKGERLRFIPYVETVLGLPCPTKREYFNCGVMVLDLDIWRRDAIAERTVAALTERTDLYYMDQDALNFVVRGDYVPLDARWNSFANCAFPAFVNVLVRVTAVGRAWERLRGAWRRDPWIVHYAGANKPWAPQDPTTPKDSIWWDYAARSPLRDRVIRDYRQLESAAQARRSKVPAGFTSAVTPG